MAWAIDGETAALMVEPIQGEGSVVVPPDGYLRSCARWPEEHRVLLILDEVQTGMGGTGRLFAHQHQGITPDVLTIRCEANARSSGAVQQGIAAAGRRRSALHASLLAPAGERLYVGRA
jgi:acetylornithine/succinyldiaminopimelate/putrescine aminotransferase